MKTKLTLCLTGLFLAPLALGKTYHIRKGQHYADGIHVGVYFGNDLKFKARFNETAIYNLGNTNQGDTNKLYGFSDCLSQHHENSARFGWRWNEQVNRLEIRAYSYAKGKRLSEFMDYIDLNKDYGYEIKVVGSTYEFYFNNKKIVHPRGCNGMGRGYKLYPYFGGDEVAPHDMDIVVN